MGELIKGKPVADAMTEELVKKVHSLKNLGITPKLTIVRVGENPGDLAYERGALKRCEAIGIDVEVKEFPKDIVQEKFIVELEKVNKEKAVNGILVLRPLPKQIDEKIIKNIIAPEKDIDCFSPINMAKLMEKDKSGFSPCTPSAVIEILKHYNISLKGKNAVVLGRSMVVGKPVSMLLLDEDCTVTICHSKTENLQEVCKNGDILVSAIGMAMMIDSSYIKEGAVVIDVGINTDESGNLCGDCLTESCLKKASKITPVPAGVGSVTTSILAKHVIKAAMNQNKMKLT